MLPSKPRSRPLCNAQIASKALGAAGFSLPGRRPFVLDAASKGAIFKAVPPEGGCDAAERARLPERARADRQYADGRAHAARARPLAALRQAREPEPGRLDQGPHRALDDRGGRVPRAAQARRRADRGDRRQYRPRLGARRRAEGLQAHPPHPRQDEPGEDLPFARARRRGDPHPLGRGQGSSGILSGHGGAFSPRDPRRLLRQPVRQSRQPAGPRGDDRPRDLVADGGQARCGRLRRRLRRHLDRPLALSSRRRLPRSR